MGVIVVSRVRIAVMMFPEKKEEVGVVVVNGFLDLTTLNASNRMLHKINGFLLGRDYPVNNEKLGRTSSPSTF